MISKKMRFLPLFVPNYILNLLKMKKIFLAVILFIVSNHAFSQIPKEKAKQIIYLLEKEKKAKDTLSLVTNYIKTVKVTDSALNKMDGRVYYNTKKDSLVFHDHSYANEIDKKWMRELYSSGLFDTINRTIADLEYEEVIYEELPTDTLKALLARLNKDTPINIKYHPSMDSVIKMFLKNRRKHVTRLMAISEFYFPLFEQSLDNHDIPLEMKYLAIVESAL